MTTRTERLHRRRQRLARSRRRRKRMADRSADLRTDPPRRTFR